LEALGTFEGTIDHRSLVYAAVAVFPTERNVHHHVESPERFAAFGRPPDHREANARDQALNQIAPLRSECDSVEGNELDLRRGGRGVAGAALGPEAVILRPVHRRRLLTPVAVGAFVRGDHDTARRVIFAGGFPPSLFVPTHSPCSRKASAMMS